MITINIVWFAYILWIVSTIFIVYTLILTFRMWRGPDILPLIAVGTLIRNVIFTVPVIWTGFLIYESFPTHDNDFWFNKYGAILECENDPYVISNEIIQMKYTLQKTVAERHVTLQAERLRIKEILYSNSVDISDEIMGKITNE